jgi:hypothetical protein
MDGIIVLNEVLVNTNKDVFIIALALCSGLVIIFSVIGILNFLDGYYVPGALVCFLSVMVIIFIIGLVGNYNQNKDTPQQKVIIDESTNFTEFTNKYKIIEQEGKIFTVQPK